ncbi:MAG TPA: hypothetical protein VFF58_00875 [Candidatus Nitrosotalea sp.]|nr:hypothetical protein [Candidatus Nitrosotalea sp.]
MALTLKQQQGITDVAAVLYDFLPGSGSTVWKGHINFGTVAAKVGVERFWKGGSKLPALTELLSQTLDREPSCFERLVLEIVRGGITYRQKERRPVAPEEIERLNGALLGVGFKFPDLWDPDFIGMLRLDDAGRAKTKVDSALQEERLRATALSTRSAHLEALKERLFKLHGEPNRQSAGFALERLLNELFALEGLSPTESFRVIGEQIDGAFELDHEPYLLEAKWEREPLGQDALLVFRGKVEGKSSYTRGLFLSLSGISLPAAQAIVTGKQPNFFVMDGHELTMVLTQDIDLVQLLRQRRRLLGDRGRVVVPYKDLWTS